jgi:WD40 repeat protein
MSAPADLASPSRPYPGIEPFQFTDQTVFFARASDVGSLMQYVNVYRTVLCYGDSGAGKSSLVNAGLIPQAIAQGFCPERFRVQPTTGEEIVIERVAASIPGAPPFLPSIFSDEDTTARSVLSAEMFGEKVRGWTGPARPLLIFDQFEELVTQFEEAPVGVALKDAGNAKERILEVLAALITDPGLHVKLLFSFREDYLAKILRLFDFWPEIRDQYVRITPPSRTSLLEIIRGPFERNPGVFETEIKPDLAERIATAMGERNERGMVNLSELQIALVRLWQSADPGTLFEDRGIQGLIEDYTTETLGSIPPDLRSSTVALLSNMITESGARNVISEEDLLSRVEDEEGIARDLLKEALRFLEQDARLIRREHRHEVAFYEIVSEFLTPWITRQREQAETIRELQHAQTMATEAAKRRLRRVGVVFLILIPLVVVPLALFAFTQRREAVQQRKEAERLAHQATSKGLAAQALLRMDEQPDLALLLAVQAVRSANTVDARGSLLSALQRYPRLSGFLRPPVGAGEPAPLELLAYSRNGTEVVGVDHQGRLSLWDLSTGESRIAVARDYYGVPTSLAVSSDGTTVVVANSDRRIYKWDLTAAVLQGEMFARLRGEVVSMALASDGSLLAVDDRSDIYRWDTGLGDVDPDVIKTTGSIQLHHPATFSPDGSKLASSISPGIVYLTDVATGVVRAVDVGEQGRIDFMAFNPSNESLAAAIEGGQVLILEPSSGYQPRAILNGDGIVRALSFSDDGVLLAAAYEGPDSQTTVSLFNAETGRAAGSFDALAVWSKRDRDPVSIAFDSKDHTMLTPSSGGVVLEWTTESALPFGEQFAKVPYGASAISDDGATLAVARGRGSAIRLIDASTGDLIDRENTDRHVLSLTFAPDGSMLASTHDACRRQRESFGFCSFQPGGSDIFTISPDETIEQATPLPTGYVFAGFAPDGRVALGSTRGVVLADISPEPPSGRVWSSMSGRAELIQVALSPDGDLIAIGDQEGIMIYRIDLGKLIGHLQRQGPYFHEGLPGSPVVTFDEQALAFTPDSRTLIVGTTEAGKTLLLVAIPRGRSIEGSVATDPGTSVAVDSEGVHATSALGARFTLWDLATGRAIGSPISVAGFGVREIHFSSSNDLVTTSENVVHWDLRIRNWRRRACQVAGRDLTRDEWKLFLPPKMQYRETCSVGGSGS